MKKFIHLNELTDEDDIVTEVQRVNIMPKGQAVNIVIKDLITNNITNFSIQSDKSLLNQATASCHQSTYMRQPTRHAIKAAASRQQKQVKII